MTMLDRYVGMGLRFRCNFVSSARLRSFTRIEPPPTSLWQMVLFVIRCRLQIDTDANKLKEYEGLSAKRDLSNRIGHLAMCFFTP